MRACLYAIIITCGTPGTKYGEGEGYAGRARILAERRGKPCAPQPSAPQSCSQPHPPQSYGHPMMMSKDRPAPRKAEKERIRQAKRGPKAACTPRVFFSLFVVCVCARACARVRVCACVLCAACCVLRAAACCVGDVLTPVFERPTTPPLRHARATTGKLGRLARGLSTSGGSSRAVARDAAHDVLPHAVLQVSQPLCRADQVHRRQEVPSLVVVRGLREKRERERERVRPPLSSCRNLWAALKKKSSDSRDRVYAWNCPMALKSGSLHRPGGLCFGRAGSVYEMLRGWSIHPSLFTIHPTLKCCDCAKAPSRETWARTSTARQTAGMRVAPPTWLPSVPVWHCADHTAKRQYRPISCYQMTEFRMTKCYLESSLNRARLWLHAGNHI